MQFRHHNPVGELIAVFGILISFREHRNLTYALQQCSVVMSLYEEFFCMNFVLQASTPLVKSLSSSLSKLATTLYQFVVDFPM